MISCIKLKINYCSITVKDKAEVLVEVERLRAVQAELNAELASLHTDLEKERSKNADPRAKDKVILSLIRLLLYPPFCL